VFTACGVLAGLRLQILTFGGPPRTPWKSGLRASIFIISGLWRPAAQISPLWRASADIREIRLQGIDFHDFRPLAAQGSNFTSLAGLRGHTGKPASGHRFLSFPSSGGLWTRFRSSWRVSAEPRANRFPIILILVFAGLAASRIINTMFPQRFTTTFGGTCYVVLSQMALLRSTFEIVCLISNT
jgi:hypothetical protein